MIFIFDAQICLCKLNDTTRFLYLFFLIVHPFCACLVKLNANSQMSNVNSLDIQSCSILLIIIDA